jgi:hypothetical protein
VDSAAEAKALTEGQAIEAKRMEKLKRENPDAGKPAKRNRGGEQ